MSISRYPYMSARWRQYYETQIDVLFAELASTHGNLLAMKYLSRASFISQKYVLAGMLFAAFNLVGQSASAQSVTPGVKPVRAPCGAGMVRHFAPRNSPEPAVRGGIVAANLTQIDIRRGQLKIDFAGHSTFVITSAAGVRVITDYNDNHRAPVLPDIATMSAVHRNHNTDNIEPVVTHALRGWNDGTGKPRHDVTLRDVRVYSLSVNDGSAAPFARWDSSIFVIDSNGLCVAHLGLLAHVLDNMTLARLGRVDVLLVPIDMRVSQSFEETVKNIQLINPRIVVPMHFFSEFTLGEFLGGIKKHFPVRRDNDGAIIVEKSTLPEKTEILYMVPPHLQNPL